MFDLDFVSYSGCFSRGSFPSLSDAMAAAADFSELDEEEWYEIHGADGSVWFSSSEEWVREEA